ncbi:N-acetyltransferase [Hyphococcus flavus]|uniref:N-acetyltransferase n=1 Tax=Hyphococcus flavus TaxID=1866326 RepID=A0AAE9ZHH6_9PROT|nr:N-acetyltransferase [Hyphococcus flavus]WDI30300.1 N-acetyltransferase [Hyphococcus flavus]
MTLGTIIRKVREEDREAVSAVLTAAFEREAEARLVQNLWAQHAVQYERLAEVSGVIIGYCAFSAVTCKPDLDGLLLGLGPIAVAPEHQNQGIGGDLVNEGLKLCRENNARLVAVLGDPDYYARFGFEPASKKRMTWAGFDAGDAFRIITNTDDNFDDLDPDDIRTIHYHSAFNDVS